MPLCLRLLLPPAVFQSGFHSTVPMHGVLTKVTSDLSFATSAGYHLVLQVLPHSSMWHCWPCPPGNFLPLAFGTLSYHFLPLWQIFSSLVCCLLFYFLTFKCWGCFGLCKCFLLWAALWVLPNSYVEVLAPSTLSCDVLEIRSLRRQLKGYNEVIGVSPNLIWLVSW